MIVNKDWDRIIDEAYGLDKLNQILDKLSNLRQEKTIYPQEDDVFTAFKLTDFSNIKVVILGQDPYFNPGEAHGLAFSVQKGIKLPPSLKNIFKELQNDLGYQSPISGDLTKWSKQGVFLLNSSLSVEEKIPNSHSNLGWQSFTDSIIQYISQEKNNVVFILWGNFARKKATLIDDSKHLIIESSHPSPLSARHSFFGSKVFSRTNNYLYTNGQTPIDWSLNYVD